MSPFSFHSGSGPILIDASASGPENSLDFRLILDTGATTSLIDRDVLIHLGYNPAAPSRRVDVTTGSSVERLPVFTLNRLTVFGKHRLAFPVVAHTLPRVGAGIMGLLGLDFLRGHRLEINFKSGLLSFE